MSFEEVLSDLLIEYRASEGDEKALQGLTNYLKKNNLFAGKLFNNLKVYKKVHIVNSFREKYIIKYLTLQGKLIGQISSDSTNPNWKWYARPDEVITMEDKDDYLVGNVGWMKESETRNQAENLVETKLAEYDYILIEEVKSAEYKDFLLG